jgi:phosphoenolpyruvate carboxykinase (ATP)
MDELGIRNPSLGLEAIGFKDLDVVRFNFGTSELYEESLRRGEAQLTADGALRALTGQHTGRSPKDKFVRRSISPFCVPTCSSTPAASRSTCRT